jgi:hypothetical protein
MKNLLFALLLGSLMLMAADCNNNDDDVQPEQNGVVELNFKGQFDNDLLMMFARDYDYEADMKVRFQLFRFYVSSIALQHADMPGVAPILDEIALIDFKNVQSEIQANDGITLRYEVEPGEYSGVNFGLGVSDVLNKTNPGNYDPTHPLSDNYWSAATGYVFTKIEGNADVDGDGELTEKITFHIGGDQFYRGKTYNKAFTVRPGQTTRLNFEVDLHRVLAADASNFIDFRKVTIDHTNDMDLATFISDNLANAVTLVSN